MALGGMGAIPASYMPLEDFQGVELRGNGRGVEVWLPGQQRPDILAEEIDVPERKHSRGIQYILDGLLEYLVERVRIGRFHNQQKSLDRKRWVKQRENIAPPKGENMMSRVAHGAVLEVDRNVIRTVRQTVLSGPFFAYEPDDETEYGRQIAESNQEIARKQIDTSTFERHLDLFMEGSVVFGYCIALAEHYKRLEMRIRDGSYRDEIVDRGTTLDTILPDFMLFSKWEEADTERQPAIGYVHEVTLPMLLSDHLVAIVSEGNLVIPHGTYFNLYELMRKTRGSSGQGYRISEYEQDRQARENLAADAAIRHLLAFTFWCKDLNIPGLVKGALSRGSSLQEIYLELGWWPDAIQNCRIWKLTAVATDAGFSITGPTPDVLVQALPTPYGHGRYPIIGTQCISFLNRFIGLGFGEICHDLQLVLNTMMTMLVDNMIRGSVDMWVMDREAVANPPDQWQWIQGGILEKNPNAPPGAKVLERIQPDVHQAQQYGLVMLDKLYATLRQMAGTQSPPFSGRRTAYEIAEIINQQTGAIQTQVGRNVLRALDDFAQIQQENNQRFLDEEDAVRLAGRAGLDVGAVREFHASMGYPMTAYPVHVRVIGKQRMLDKVTATQIFTQIMQTPPIAIWMQMLAAGQQPPEPLKRIITDLLEGTGAVEDASRYFPGMKTQMTTEQVIQMLRMGQPVEVDLSRFRDPEEAIREINIIAGLADQSELAAWYVRELARRTEQWIMETVAVRQMLGQVGQGGQGGQGFPTQQRSIPGGAMTTAAAQVRGISPTSPGPMVPTGAGPMGIG